jgi:RNA polymerase sigma-70 factor (ECF subfamily)
LARLAGTVALYVIIPSDLAPELHEPLRRHFLRDRSTHVIVERRSGDQPAQEPRSGRRVQDPKRPPSSRRLVLPGRAPDLPPEAVPHKDALRFVLSLDADAPGAADPETLQLVARFQHGDARAFDALYRRHYGQVYGFVRMALHNVHQAEDVTQEVFTRASQALPRYEIRPEVPFRAWLMAISRGEVLRVLKRQPAEPLDPHEIAAMPALSGPDRPTRWLTLPGVSELVDALPERQQQVLVLRYAIGLSGEETASVMGTTRHAVDGLRRRALDKLRDGMSELGYEPAQTRTDRLSMSERLRTSPVLRRRRSILWGLRRARAAQR